MYLNDLKISQLVKIQFFKSVLKKKKKIQVFSRLLTLFKMIEPRTTSSAKSTL